MQENQNNLGQPVVDSNTSGYIPPAAGNENVPGSNNHPEVPDSFREGVRDPVLLQILIDMNQQLADEKSRNEERWVKSQEERQEIRDHNRDQSEKLSAVEKRVSSMIGVGNLITIGTGILASIVIHVVRNLFSW